MVASGLDLRDSQAASEFTVLGFYKIFRYLDLGALTIRKDSAGLLRLRYYFSGGTVDGVVIAKCSRNFYARKADLIHTHLEKGTLVFCPIPASGTAFSTDKRLYSSLIISPVMFSHSPKNFTLLTNLTHENRSKFFSNLCPQGVHPSASVIQEPIIAFNMQRADRPGSEASRYLW